MIPDTSDGKSERISKCKERAKPWKWGQKKSSKNQNSSKDFSKNRKKFAPIEFDQT